MRAVVYHGPADIRLDTVPDPEIQAPTDAIVRLTSSAICGTDLHLIRGTMPGMKEGTILGHEGIGIVEEVGPSVRGLRPGDRVVIPSTISCGTCSYCRAGYTAQCDNANPNGPAAGTAFFGGPESTGPIDGLQAELARIPYAATTLVPLHPIVSDNQAILLSDIFPTGWFGASLAEVHTGDTVLVLGCGPVGLFAILSAWQQGAGRVLAVDGIDSRLDAAQALHAETINFNTEDPIQVVKDLTGGVGVDRVIDAVGVDAQRPKTGPAAEQADQQADDFARQRTQVAPDAQPHDDTWIPGDAPTQAAQWAVETIAKAGTIGVIGVYPPNVTSYPFGAAMMKNLTIKMGNCNHHRYLRRLIDLVASGAVDPATVITQKEPLTDVIAAYETFDRREPGWVKAILEPAR